MQCISVPKAGRLCEQTIAADPPPTGGPACFEILDLSKDERFNRLPFVRSAPRFKYYVGVPIRTKRGINIGSLFALDDKPRKEPISESNRLFLGTMADNVMAHMEMMREKEERKRALNMTQCLASFVDPEHGQIRKRKRNGTGVDRPDLNTGRELMAAKSGPLANPPASPWRHREDISARSGGPARSTLEAAEQGDARRSDVDESSSSSESESGTSPRIEEADHRHAFDRAAHLLSDALSLEDGGGVVFLGTTNTLARGTGGSAESSGDSSDDEGGTVFQRRASLHDISIQSSSSQKGKKRNPLNKRPTQRPAEVLSSSTTTMNGFVPVSSARISKLIKKHPRGRLFTFDEDGLLDTCSSDEKTHSDTPQTAPILRKSASKSDAAYLSKHFPGARQIVFLPLWNPASSSWSACFAYNQSQFRTLSNNPDFLYCIAFSNCLITEIGRLATLAADQQKSDFIGSISHELRSPLHGILASCEFLGDTDCTSFQKSLVDTADSCARTLLDTINMVLDYSKINSFERNMSKAKKSRRNRLAEKPVSEMQPSLNIYGDVDLAAITEEVVEGVATGQVFQNSLTNPAPGDLSDEGTRGRTSARAVNKANAAGAVIAQAVSKADVEIVLDIAAQDWTFVTQPGAFRRVVMNLFGNALKYTRRGFIKVKLEAQRPARSNADEKGDVQSTTMVTLTVTDSGRGISPEYMRTKLFTAFAQESTLAPGTGLGLSLVRSIVDMLSGDINIKSALNVGTEVTVKLPMTQSPPSTSTSGSTPSSAGSSIERIKDDSVRIVQEKARGRSVALFFRRHLEASKEEVEAAEMVRNSLARYLTGWFGFTAVKNWSPTSRSDVVVTDEVDLPALTAAMPEVLEARSGIMVIVLCTTASRGLKQANKHAFSGNVEALSHPFGPYKLAKALRLCFDRDEACASGVIPEVSEDSGVDPVIAAVQQVTLSGPDADSPDVSVLEKGAALGREDSVNAQMAMDSYSTSVSSSSTEQKEEYPFPANDSVLDGTVSPPVLSDNRRPLLEPRKTISPTRTEILAHEPTSASPVSKAGALTAAAVPARNLVTRSPRVLLVDGERSLVHAHGVSILVPSHANTAPPDNKVNLRLLQTFMKKRKYSTVSSAEDGQQAVNTFRLLISQNPPQPPDVVFMDIS